MFFGRNMGRNIKLHNSTLYSTSVRGLFGVIVLSLHHSPSKKIFEKKKKKTLENIFKLRKKMTNYIHIFMHHGVNLGKNWDPFTTPSQNSIL